MDAVVAEGAGVRPAIRFGEGSMSMEEPTLEGASVGQAIQELRRTFTIWQAAWRQRPLVGAH